MGHRLPLLLLALAVLSSCVPPDVDDDAGRPADAGASPRNDAGVVDNTDAGPRDAGVVVVDSGVVDAGSATVDAGEVDDGGVVELPPMPDGLVLPQPGELSMWHLHLEAGLSFSPLGESSLIIGPDGTLVLVDVGSASHAESVYDLVVQVNTQWLTPARGYAVRGPTEVDFVVLTHFHGDHVGAMEDLLEGPLALDVTQGIVHRGFTDVGAALNENDVEYLCGALGPGGPFAELNRPLCTTTPPLPCDKDAWGTTFAATSCALHDGDLTTLLDDGTGLRSHLPLGEHARLYFVAANGHVSQGDDVVAFGGDIGTVDSNQENARSIVGVVEHGAFRSHFGGDLTGEGTAEAPDVESHLATAGHAHFGDLGVDLAHAHHHGRDTSNNLALVDLLAPTDGRSRNVVAGINAAYVGSPQADVVENFTADGRLGDGKLWVTHWARFGAVDVGVVDAEGDVVVQTWSGGSGYFVQAASQAPPVTQRFVSVRADNVDDGVRP